MVGYGRTREGKLSQGAAASGDGCHTQGHGCLTGVTALPEGQRPPIEMLISDSYIDEGSEMTQGF